LISRRAVAALGLGAPLFAPLLNGRAFAQGAATPPPVAVTAPPPAGVQTTPLEPAPEPAPASGEAEPNTELPTTDTNSSHILAPVMVNGRGPFQFLVDTGANRSAIGSAIATQLGLKAGPPVKLHTVAGERSRPTVILDELKVGERVQRRIRVPTFPISGITADGILGVDWLKNRRLAFQFKSNSLEITASRQDDAASFFDRSAVVVPARLRSGQITIVDADLSGRKISAMIDTGGQLSLGNDALREMIRNTQNPGKSQEMDLITVTGERLRGELLYVPFIRLGGLLLGNVPIVFARVHVFSLWNMERDPAIILGMDLLRQFDAISLDFGRARVRFDLS
jgi:predicted aspartyl protease